MPKGSKPVEPMAIAEGRCLTREGWNLHYLSQMSYLLVMPEQCFKILPNLGVAIEICHGVEHAGLNGFSSVAEKVHDGTPCQGSKD